MTAGCRQRFQLMASAFEQAFTGWQDCVHESTVLVGKSVMRGDGSYKHGELHFSTPT